MKKYSMIIFPIVISSIIILFIRCSEDPFTIPDINTSLPVITSIEASETRILIETSVQVSVTAQQGDSYSWSAADGSFDAPTSSTTNWTASSTGGVYKLTCTVTNSSGSRKASINMQVLETLLPDGVTSYWSFDTNLKEEVSDTEGEGGVGVSITTDAAVGDGAALFDGGDDGNIESALFYADANAPMGPEDLFTITLWVKTEDEEMGFLFGRSFEGDYFEGAKGLYINFGPVVFDIAWIDGFETEDAVNDGEWHHIAVVKGEGELFIYIDGEEALFVEFAEWSDDDGTVVTLGAASEYGDAWPGTFNGTMDDVRFYPDALSEEEIIAIYEGG